MVLNNNGIKQPITKMACHQHTYQIFINHKAEDEAVNSSKLVLCINHVKHGQHPLYEKNLQNMCALIIVTTLNRHNTHRVRQTNIHSTQS